MPLLDKEGSGASSRRLWMRRAWPAVTLLILLTLVAGIRFRLRDQPLERDEGEYAYAGQLMLQGVPPYQEMYNMKWPGAYAAYAVIMAIFGQTAAGIHGGLILVNALTAFLVFVLARRIAGDWGGVVAGGTYGLLSISPGTVGLAAHATHFVMLPALAGILLLQNPGHHDSRLRVFCAGIFLGLATVMKQSGAAFAVFAALWILSNAVKEGREDQGRRAATRMGPLLLGGLAPIVGMGVVLMMNGVFGRFWQWTVQYAGAYASICTFPEAWGNLKVAVQNLWRHDPVLWSLALAGVVPLMVDDTFRRWRFFVLTLTLCSCLAVCPGWYFREHYFIQLLPAAALMAGMAAEAALREFARRGFGSASGVIVAAVLMVAASSSLLRSREIYFSLNPRQACCEIYQDNPFPEAQEIGRFLEANCPADGRIAVLGSEPEIYFYSHRRAATGYIYTYPLMESQPYAVPMQDEMIRQIEKCHPQYVVSVHVRKSWMARQDSDFLILNWFGKYEKERLEPVGVVEILSKRQAAYRWLKEGETAPEPRSSSWLTIFRSRDARGAPLKFPANAVAGPVER